MANQRRIKICANDKKCQTLINMKVLNNFTSQFFLMYKYLIIDSLLRFITIMINTFSVLITCSSLTCLSAIRQWYQFENFVSNLGLKFELKLNFELLPINNFFQLDANSDVIIDASTPNNIKLCFMFLYALEFRMIPILDASKTELHEMC